MQNIKTNSDWLNNDLFHAVYSEIDYLKDYNNDTIPNKEEIVLISIKNPGKLPHPKEKIEGFADILQVQFWDIEETFGKYEAISKEIGKDIKRFIEKNREKRFLVHCAAGQSRSAGVACAVECIVNFDGNDYYYKTGSSDVKAHKRYSVNWAVYDSIIK